MARFPRPRLSRLRLAIGAVAALAAVLIALRPSAPAPAVPLVADPQPAPELSPLAPSALHESVVVMPKSTATKTFPSASPITALLDWSTRYIAAPASERARLLPEGIELARARRPVLAGLIRTDPEAALAASLPRSVRAQMPAEIVAELEQLVSTRAELAVIQTCFHPPGTAHAPGDDLYRATVIDGREYRAHVYGSRLHDASLPATSLHGIALDGHLAVGEARYRTLESDEALPASLLAAASPGALAVEADGAITLLPSPDSLPAFAAALVATEENPLVNEADSGAGSSTVTGRPTQAWTHGAKTLLVIRVDFSDRTGTPVHTNGAIVMTPAYLDSMINGATGVRAFMQQSSYGKADLLFDPATDVTDVLRLPQTAAYYARGDGIDAFNTLLHSDARAAAATAGFDVSGYDRVAVVFSSLGDIVDTSDPKNKPLLSYGGLANIVGKNLWVNGEFDLRVVGHELGHNLGLRHANLWRPTGGSPVSLTGDDPATLNKDERSVEYGDPFDLMGEGDFPANDFSHWNKSLLQWLLDSAVTVANASGTYRVYRFDSSTANLAAPRALKVVRDTTRDYWIGYRRATSSSAADNGAYVLWGYNAAGSGHLLDLVTPGTNADDAPLPLNTTFDDTAAGIALRPVAQGGSGADEWLDVQVTLQPRLAWTASTYVVNEQGGSATLTVTRTANATGNVSVSYATAPGTASATLDYTHTTGTLSWPDGDTSPKTIVVPLVADSLVEGTETFTVTLSSPVGGVVVDPASATVTLADPGARDPNFAAEFINSTVYRTLPQPDGSILIAGAFTQLQATSFTAYSYGRIARLTSAGAIDPDFNPGTGANGTIRALARQPDGKILVGGDFTSINGVARNRIARLNTDGSLDSTFDPGAGANGTVYALLLLPDGDLLVGGGFTTFDGVAREYLARLDAGGSPDPAFVGPDFGATSTWRVESLALQPDQKILVGGVFYFTGGSNRAGICRLLPTGALDSATFTGVTNGAHLAGTTSSLRTVERIAVQPDGKIVIVGSFTAFNNTARSGVARLTSTGALDSDFAPQPDSTCSALRLLPDGRILIGGDFTTVNGTAALRIACLQANGALDTAFAAAGGHTSTVRDLALQPDGNVLLAGNVASFQAASPNRPVWRLVPGLAGTPGTLQFATDATAAVEGVNATLSVTRTDGSLGALTVGYATVAGTATAGTDFTTTSGVLSWADGDTATKTITVPTTLDANADTPETFLVNLGAPLIGGSLLGERQQATVTLASAFAAWQATRFGAAELAAPAISGDAADPDGDGLNNLAEFALGRDPRLADSAAAWTTAIQNVAGTNYLTITFRRRAPALDLAYVVQTSGDLAGAWSVGAVQVGSATANGDGTETVTFRDSVASTSAGRRFLRVLVTRTP